MKLNRLLFTLGLLFSSLGVVGCNKTVPHEELKEFFQTLNESNYNFTFSSQNEGNTVRELQVYSKDAYLLGTGLRGKISSRYGIFYVNEQGTQDYHLDSSGNVVIDFYEGPGRVENIPETFANDLQYGSDSGFSHVPLSKALALDASKFTFEKESNGELVFLSKDREINRDITFLSNAYYANWDRETREDYYLDFNKCETRAYLSGDIVTFELTCVFQKSFTSAPKNYDDKPYFTISNIGNTSNKKIADYLANPSPLSPKTAYYSDEVKYEETFGDANLPFAGDKHGSLLSVSENYRIYSVDIFDSSANEDISSWFVNQFENTDWIYSKDDSDSAKETFSYHDADIKTYVKEVTIDQNGQFAQFKVYFTFVYVPKAMLDEFDKLLRPNGFFYGELYRLTDNEAVYGYDNVKAVLDNNALTEYIPIFPNYDGFNYSISSLASYFDEVILDNGFMIVSYYIVTITGFTSEKLQEFINEWKTEILKNSAFQDVDDSSEPFTLAVGGTFDEGDGLLIGQNILGQLETKDNSTQSYKISIITTAKEK